MPNSKQIVYLSQSQYAELIANGSITVDGVTVTYDENDIYVTPQAEPVTDVRVAGASVAANGVANIPIGSAAQFGVMRAGGPTFGITANNGIIAVAGAGSSQVKAGGGAYPPIVTLHQHEAAFYGLAKAAGHDEKDSTESLGTYTPEAKGAIQKMLGVSDLIATSENDLVASKAYAVGDVFTANGKLYKVIAAIAADEAIVLQNEGETVSGANAVETKIGEGFVKFTDYATSGTPGVMIVRPYDGHQVSQGRLIHKPAASSTIKNGTDANDPIVSSNQHASAFYGLAKAAGDTTQSASSNAIGQYTDDAAAAIRSMIGAENGDDIVKVQDTEPTTAATKIWLPETAPASVEVPTVAEMNAALAGKVGDVQIDGTSIVTDGVADIPIAISGGASSGAPGVVRVLNTNMLGITLRSWDGKNGFLTTSPPLSSQIKSGVMVGPTLSPGNQHEATFYGLAKAAGHDEKDSTEAFGTYTDEAKAAIRTMLGAVGSEDYASTSTAGVVKISSADGTTISADGTLKIGKSSTASIKAGSGTSAFLMPSQTDLISFYGLAKASGDTTQSASSNAVGTYTDDAKLAIQTMLGIDLFSIASQVEIPLVETVGGSAVTISGQPNTRYMCGEVTSISITPPASGSIDVVFTSGSTVAVLTLPSTVKMPEWFDASTLDTDTVYEILITDGVYGSVMTWQA